MTMRVVKVMVGWLALLALVVNVPAPAAGSDAAVNKPSNPAAHSELVAAFFSWDSGDPATYDRGRSAFAAVRSAYPDTLEADIALVELLHIRWMGFERDGVLKDYEQWLTTQPSPVAQGWALKLFGDHALENGNLAEAENLYLQALPLQGGHVLAGDTASALAKVYLTTGRIAQGLVLLEQTAVKFTGTPIEGEVRRDWAKAMRKYGGAAPEAAQEQARSILAPTLTGEAPSISLARARYNLAEVLAMLGRPAEALAACELAAGGIRADADGEWAPHCVRLLIDLQQRLGRWDDAIASAGRYIELHPRFALAHLRLSIGLSYAGKGDAASAITEFDKALAYYAAGDPTRGEALYKVAATLIGLRLYAEVHRYLDLIRTDPSPSLAAWREAAEYLDAVAYYHAGDYATALPALRKVASSSSRQADREAAQALITQIEASAATR